MPHVVRAGLRAHDKKSAPSHTIDCAVAMADLAHSPLRGQRWDRFSTHQLPVLLLVKLPNAGGILIQFNF